MSSGATLASFYTTYAIPLSAVVGTVTVGVILKTLLHYGETDEPPELYHKEDSPLVRHLLKTCKRLTEPYRPPIWARNAHVQTVLPLFLPKAAYEFKRHYVTMVDGGVVALDYGDTNVTDLSSKSPVMLVLPGYNGDANGMASVCRLAAERGFRPIVFNKRGLGGSHITTPKLQSFGDTSDLRKVVETLKEIYPEAHLVAVGVSAGSGLLASYMGEYGSSTLLSAAVCSCPGYKLEVLLRKLRQPYDFALLQSIKRMLSKHRDLLSKVIDVDAAMRARRCIEFEELVYSKLYGYSSMEEYWERNEPGRDIDKVAIPVLCINSLDDPICIEENIPRDLFKSSPNFLLALTARGGHCGFIESTSWTSWADQLSVEYTAAVIEFLDNTNM